MRSAFYFKIGWQTTKTNVWTITFVEQKDKKNPTMTGMG